jgi:branched-chain amino acid transport system permease protein
MDYVLGIIIIAILFAVIGVSTDLLVGHSGLLSLAASAFVSVGAYATAISTTRFGCSWLTGLILGCLIAVMLASFIAVGLGRTKGDTFVVGTFAAQLALTGLAFNWTLLTNGAEGIPGIPPIKIGPWNADTKLSLLSLSMCVLGLAMTIVRRLTTGSFGRVLHAIREDEVLAKSLAKNTLGVKIVTLSTSAAICSIAGTFYAHYISYVDPTSFTLTESILVVSMVIIGGAGSLWGPLIGAIVLTTLPEALRFMGLPTEVAASLRQIIYGSLLVIMMMFRPRGLVGKYGFTR